MKKGKASPAELGKLIPQFQQAGKQNVKDGLWILGRVELSSLKFWWAASSYSIFKAEKELLL